MKKDNSALMVEKEINRFKMDLLRGLPFYGDIVIRLPFVVNRKIATARTDGTKIEYNPAFLGRLPEGERNFVLMHEVFHVLLFHFKRGNRNDPKLWNTAADIIVNDMLARLERYMELFDIPFRRPKFGVFAPVLPHETMENLYEKLQVMNRGQNKKAIVFVPIDTLGQSYREETASDDLATTQPGAAENNGAAPTPLGGSDGLSEQALMKIIRKSGEKNLNSTRGYFVPLQIYRLAESRMIKWRPVLRDFLTEGTDDDTSYATPERKYIHMDLIMPGHCRNEEQLEEVWAFVDCSGSIGQNETEQFLTQLCRICREFKCTLNLCYWDTQVHEVYRGIKKADDVLRALPQYSGDTDINCVYGWLHDSRVNPDLMLVLTDGCFPSLDSPYYRPSLRKKTILVLTGFTRDNENLRKIGRIVRL